MSTSTLDESTSPFPGRPADRLLLKAGIGAGRWLALVAATTLVIAGAELALPAMLARAIDAVAHGAAAGRWLWWSAALVVVLIACQALDELAAGATVARATAWLRHDLVRHALALGAPTPGGMAPSELAGRLVANTADAGRAAPDAVRAIGVLLPALGGTVALALIDPWLCVTFLAGLPVLLFVLRTFARDASELARRYFEVQGTIAARLVDALAGARTIAAAGTAEREARRVLEPLPELHRHGIAVWRTQMRITAQDAVLVTLLEIAVLGVAGVELGRGRISAGGMVAAGQYVLLAATLQSALTFVARLARSRAAAERLVEVLDQPPVAYGSARLPAGGGRVEFRDVCVRDGDRVVLDGLNLVVPAGCMVALVGPSGAGKSLLAALAGRLVDPDSGSVLLDGVALGQLSRTELRGAIGFGFERPVLIGETLGDAIAGGDRHAGAPAIAQAAKAAQADGFIRRMPAGYATLLADAPMSGGEIQRIGLARAFMGRRRLLILDDVAASLDTVTEHQVRLALTGALADRTRIIVTHRPSTAARADLVAWLQDGAVRALAPHDELWRRRDYRRLFEADAERATPLRVVGSSEATA